MNLLTLNPISSCNLSCEHCPNREWTYPIDDERNRLNNEIIFRWMERYTNPYEWFLEISGGEPGLYPQISELIQELSERGYYGIIRTNGTMPIPKTETLIRLAGWHRQTSLENPPHYCDYMLITKNPKDCWREKAEYCKEKNIPYRCIEYKRFGDSDFIDEDDPEQHERKINTFFTSWTIVGSSGVQGYCYAYWGKDKDNIFNMAPPLMRDMTKECPTCGGMLGLLDFMDIEFMQKMDARRENYLRALRR